jgi:hypothetical protein
VELLLLLLLELLRVLDLRDSIEIAVESSWYYIKVSKRMICDFFFA